MAGYILEQKKSVTQCTYHPGTAVPDPHTHKPYKHPKLLSDDILDTVGNTPLVRLNKITRDEGVVAEVYVKCEFFNPGGSIKDRIALRMIEDAEAEGRITPGVSTIIEATSGNTGIGLALAAAVKGYRLIVTLPDKMSQEKVDALKSLGAEVIRTPTSAPFDSAESHLGVAIRLSKEIPNAVILDQYSNPSNPLSHYDQTAEEIYEQTGGRLDYLVAGVGTGGHICGLSRKLKEKIPGLIVIGVDPQGSAMALPESLNAVKGGYTIEGIGQMFLPRTCLRDQVDEWLKVANGEAFDMARRLVRQEGIFTGGSAGAAVVGAIKIAKTLPAGKRVVVILPDSIRNYLSRFINDSWMVDSGYMQPNTEGLAAAGRTVAELALVPAVVISPEATTLEALEKLEAHNFHQLPVAEHGKVIGAVTVDSINAKLITKTITPHTQVRNFLISDVRIVPPTTSVQHLYNSLVVRGFAFVKFEDHYSVVTQVDLAKFLVRNPE